MMTTTNNPRLMQTIIYDDSLSNDEHGRPCASQYHLYPADRHDGDDWRVSLHVPGQWAGLAIGEIRSTPYGYESWTPCGRRVQTTHSLRWACSALHEAALFARLYTRTQPTPAAA